MRPEVYPVANNDMYVSSGCQVGSFPVVPGLWLGRQQALTSSINEYKISLSGMAGEVAGRQGGGGTGSSRRISYPAFCIGGKND